MRSSNLDMALAREDPKSRLGAEIDELASEIALVLRNILVQGRRESGVIPCRGLGIVIHEIHSCCVRKSHLPSTREWAKLRHRLLLNSIVRILATIHPDVLLASGVNPGGGPSVVVNKVWTALGRVPLLPQRWKLS
jgi:hypothetical protein